MRKESNSRLYYQRGCNRNHLKLQIHKSKNKNHQQTIKVYQQSITNIFNVMFKKD